ncbi:phenoloxidase 1-like [Ceratina calcarata]|uniref:Phenoloxidase 1-like n=1 Tax=Ceratina calcarata TaxID=156304 RepID=A0AAJ7J471_9HYME|nr:phenoloxidase 1-like [Ceratina calcarata]
MLFYSLRVLRLLENVGQTVYKAELATVIILTVETLTFALGHSTAYHTQPFACFIIDLKMTDKSNILYLFDRPSEPIYVPKGNEKVSFDIPPNYLPEQYRNVAVQVLNRFGDEAETKIPVKQISLPDLSVPMQLGRRQPFSLFIPAHRKMAGRLIDIFLGMRTYEDFLSVSVYCRDRVNPDMFIYALSVAILHRPDTKDLPIPPLNEVFPDKYVDSGVFSRAREEANIVPAGSRIPIEIPRDYTASDLDEEHRIAYWREDIGVNLHHWHWHLVYPFEGDIRIVNKDRRGEIFYYSHQQIIARYNCERLCNKLPRVKRFINWREPIPEAYFPKLDSLVASRTWPARHGGAVLKDVNRPADDLNFDIQDMERWRDRIYEAIHTGSVMNARGERILLTEKDGIDVLGNILEASILSVNRNIYGDLHNFGHIAISFVHDPDHRYLENFAIMGDTAINMRDPIFYRWHAFVDDVFQEHKNTLPPYSVAQLDYPGVEITDVKLTSSRNRQQRNVLETFWTKSDVDMSRGLDFTPRGPVLVRFTHLNHADFVYTIVVNNRGNTPRRGTVRIFLGPRQDERGLPLPFRQQKNLMIEMDKFTVTLRPGQNTIERKSTESSVTIPFERTFRNVDQNRPTEALALDQFNFCGCGWPQHLLLPRGNKEGFPMDLFIMISDYSGDAVEQDESPSCRDAVSYCGLRDRKYPDARPMGYPFDRQPRAGVENLPQFLTGNMAVAGVTVRFSDTVVPRSGSGSVGNSLM